MTSAEWGVFRVLTVGSWQEAESCDQVRSSFNDPNDPHLMVTTGTGRIAVARWYGHGTSYFMTVFLSDGVPSPNCHCNLRTTYTCMIEDPCNAVKDIYIPWPIQPCTFYK